MVLSFLTIFFVSCALLCYEIFLIRILSIVNWGQYAYMAVSLAMLGSGFSGVLLAIKADFFRRFRARSILTGCFLFSISLPLCFYVNRKLPVNYLYLIWDTRQFFYLTVQFFLYGIPFLAASATLALFFTCMKDETGLVYAFNLAGSGAGVFFSLLTMYFLPPEKYIALTSLLAAIAGLSWGIRTFQNSKKKIPALFAAFLIVSVSSAVFSPDSLLPDICQYKGLPGILRLPGTKIACRFFSPMGIIHVVEGEKIRLAAGLSLNFAGSLPEQKALIVDADVPVPVYGFQSSFEEFRFLDSTLFASAYGLLKTPRVLIIGAGSSDVLLAKYHESASVTVVEIDPKIIKAVEQVTEPYRTSPFALPGVNVVIKEARGYIDGAREKFDLVLLNPAGSITSSAAGVYAQNEDYLNTVESYALIYRKLSPEGIFSVSKWIKTPPRDGIKLFATAFTALRNSGIQNPEKRLALIRNWDVLTLLIKKTPFNSEELNILRNFCNERGFDISYVPGIGETEINRFHRIPDETYYTAAKSIISPDSAADFFREYPFYVAPATDNKPYFSNFFRWRAVPHLVKTMKREWIPFLEHGYLTLLATFVQALIFGSLFILLPLSIKTKRAGDAENSERPGLRGYFSLLGFSYMVLEMALIQRFILFLHHPIYSVGVVIISFLLLSGAGSYVSEIFMKRGKKYRFLPFFAILAIGLLYVLTLDKIFSAFGWASIGTRIVFSFVIIAPLAFFMGMPFPFGIKRVVSLGERGVGSAWGYNGFFSVMGTVSTPFLSSIVGFRAVGITGCLGYLAAMILWYRISRDDIP